ncbi:MAG: PAS domain S-box protein [Candidatus Obscuribacter sp.]|nr:PAS domain S-box protein [Candidatus Obscuribacter sp.]MBP6592150.1 PAS domain S-box protein [Candidatus Obscuribacter sp.]MBP7577809.1 PAS domain S-box protein [Candidatus Obscuribacter sp.]
MLVQLGLLAYIVQLQNEAEEWLKTTEHSRAIADSINLTSQHAFDAVAMFGDKSTMTDMVINSPEFINQRNQINTDFDNIAQLVKNSPKEVNIATSAKSLCNTTLDELVKIMEVRAKADPANKPLIKKLWKEVRMKLPTLMSDDLMSLGREMKSVEKDSVNHQSKSRQTTTLLTIIGACLNVIFTILLATALVRWLTHRLNIIHDNTYRLAASRNLNMPLSGNDEVANIDATFHSMVRELRDARRKEQAMFTLAHDVICSLSREGRFTSVNPACDDMLGVTESDLLGTLIFDLVKMEKAKDLEEYLEHLASGGDSLPFETEMFRSDGQFLDVLFSAIWSNENQSYFCVLHNVSSWKQAQKLKEEVVAMVTHDLRNPLNTISNILELIDSGVIKQGDERYSKQLVIAKRNRDRMLSLVNDFLEMEKIRSGRTELELQSIPISELFLTVTETLEHVMSEAGIALVSKPSDLTINVDNHLIQRVLTNLVTNAVKFSPKGSQITLSAKLARDKVVISVQDQGRGIPPEMIDSIFEKYQQVTASDAKVKGGSGLGLSICREIVALHGGKIWVESQVERGSEFCFSLPASRA